MWTKEYNDAFEELKQRLTTTSILAIPNDSGKVKINNNVSDRELGCMLKYNGRVIEYSSRQFRAHEWNYQVHNRKSTLVFKL